MKQRSRTANSVINAVTGVGGQLLTTLLKFVTRTVFIATLGKAYLGINGLFSNILTMLSLTELGIDTAINFKLYKPLAEHDDHRVRVLMKFYKQAYRVVGFAILMFGLLLIPVLRLLIKDYDSLSALGINAVLIFLLYLLQSVSSYLFFAYRSAIIKAAQKTYIINIAEYITAILTNAAQIIILICFKSFIFYTAAIISFTIIQNSINAFIAQRMYPEIFKPEKDNLSKEEIISTFKDCGALFVYKVNGVILKATDNLILSTFIGLATVGLYSNYLMFYNTALLLLNRVYSSVKASMGDVYATGNMARSYFIFEVMNFLTVIFYGTACVGVAVVSNEIIMCWIGEEYLIAQPLAILMGIEILFSGLQTNLGQIRNISGAFRQMWFRPVMGSIINIIFSVWTVRFWGVYGVVLGTIVAVLTTNFMVDPFVIHKYSFGESMPVSYYYKKNIKYLTILTCIGIVDILLCRVILTGMGWLSAIVHILICGCSVPGVFYLLYRRTAVCKYLTNKIVWAVRKLQKKNNAG